MKKQYFVILFLGFVFNSCFEKPFNHTLLDSGYWDNFSQSVELVAFDQLGSNGQCGFLSDSKANCYYYINDVYDSAFTHHLYYIHYLNGESIGYSTVDTCGFSYSDIRPKIEWEILPSGIIRHAKKYNLNGELISTEEYEIEELPDSIATLYRFLTIIGKKKFNSSGELIAYLIYDENGNYTIQ